MAPWTAGRFLSGHALCLALILASLTLHVVAAKGSRISVSLKYHGRRHKRTEPGRALSAQDGSQNDQGQKRRQLLGRQPKQAHLLTYAEVGQKSNTVVLSRVRKDVDKALAKKAPKKKKGKGSSTSPSRSSWALKTDSLWGEGRRPKKFKIQIRLGSKKGKEGSRNTHSSTRASARKGSTMVNGRFSASPRRKTAVTSLSGAAPPGAAPVMPSDGPSLLSSAGRKVQGPDSVLETRGLPEGASIIRFGAGSYDDGKISTGESDVNQIGVGVGHHPPDKLAGVGRAGGIGQGTGQVTRYTPGSEHKPPQGLESGSHYLVGTMPGQHPLGTVSKEGDSKEGLFTLEHQKKLSKSGTRSVGRHRQQTAKGKGGKSGKATPRRRTQCSKCDGSDGGNSGFEPGQVCDGNQTVCDIYKGQNPGFDTCCGRLCRNLQVDELHCGSCSLTCPAANMCCGGQCKDIQSDVNNCGACFVQCSGGSLCVSGVCEQYGVPGR